MDAIVRDFGKYVFDNAEAIADAAHKETGLGVYEDKVAKAKGKARVIWNSLKGKKSRGIIGEDERGEPGVRRQADGRRRGGLPGHQPHRDPDVQRDVRAQGRQRGHLRPASEGGSRPPETSPGRTGRSSKRHDAPEDLVQMVTNGSVETTQALMKAADVVVATGGRRHGEGGLLLRQAVLRRGRRERAGHHRPRRGPAGRRREDRRRRLVRQRHHLLARAVRADAGGALRARRSRRSSRPGRSGSPTTRTQVQKLRTSCSLVAT